MLSNSYQLQRRQGNANDQSMIYFSICKSTKGSLKKRSHITQKHRKLTISRSSTRPSMCSLVPSKKVVQWWSKVIYTISIYEKEFWRSPESSSTINFLKECWRLETPLWFSKIEVNILLLRHSSKKKKKLVIILSLIITRTKSPVNQSIIFLDIISLHVISSYSQPKQSSF